MGLAKQDSLNGSVLWRRYSPLLPFITYFVFLLFFVSPAGNFPLNDDWSYGEGVHKLLSAGKLVMPTVCAPGFPHVLLGALFCKAFGFSYVCLRAVTLGVGFAGCLALYGALREAGLQRWTCAFLLLVYAGNPLFVNVWFSFMSDATALSLTNIYFYFLLRALKRSSMRCALLSVFALSLAVSTRQSALVFLPCNLSLLSLRGRRNFYPMMLAAFLAPVLVYVGDDCWLVHRQPMVHDYLGVREGHWRFVIDCAAQPLRQIIAFVVALGQTACYLGLFCLPVLLACVLSLRKMAAGGMCLWSMPSLLINGISAFQLALLDRKLMPFNKNLLRIPAVGAQGNMGICMPDLSAKALRWVTLLAFLSALFLLWLMGACIQIAAAHFGKRSACLRRAAILWSGVSGGVSAVAFCAVETMVRCADRYYLIALAPLLLCLGLLSRYRRMRIARLLPAAALVLLAGYGACAAQDYLSGNRAKWVALHHLEARGVPPCEIDGGAEYNTMHDLSIYDSNYRGKPPRDNWRWWPIRGEKYIVGYSPVPDYEIVERVRYWTALTFGHREVLVLKAMDGTK